ncbi:MAG: MBL fold metallo-hydrolase [Clostridiaceae bacterium]|nr:MBL fold metallo-hydrolase [Clostridiaceae bacterium]
MNKSSIKLTHLSHSGFLLETDNNLLIFDYFEGPLNTEVLKTEKDVLVFVSHSHGDHFSSEIFTWQEVNKNIQYVLSDDVEATIHLNTAHYIKPHETLQLGNKVIQSFGSTDQGVSFLVEVDNFKIFHAGDLNWWHWKEFNQQQLIAEETDFKKEVEYLKGTSIDIAFVPVDPRLEEFYYLAGKYFAETIHPKILVPMHFRDNFFICSKFANEVKCLDVDIIELTHRGQEFFFKG